MKRNFILTIAVAAFAFAALAVPADAKTPAANNGAITKLESAKECYKASVRKEAIQAKSSVPDKISTGPASGWLTRVKRDEVNMVTNRFEGKKLAATNMDGKTYFTAGDVYAKNLAANPSTRFAKDALTDKKIDKAEAATYADASGRVYYFESEDSFRNFIALANPETVYGYSEAK